MQTQILEQLDLCLHCLLRSVCAIVHGIIWYSSLGFESTKAALINFRDKNGQTGFCFSFQDWLQVAADNLNTYNLYHVLV